jgi:hypothetical protein
MSSYLYPDFEANVNDYRRTPLLLAYRESGSQPCFGGGGRTEASKGMVLAAGTTTVAEVIELSR